MPVTEKGKEKRGSSTPITVLQTNHRTRKEKKLLI
jgi:hypothetical protein